MFGVVAFPLTLCCSFAEPDVCDDFAIGRLTAEDDHSGPKPPPRICVPGNLEIPQSSKPDAPNLRLLLRSLNVCEGRSTNRSMTPNEEHLTISAPCTCAGVNETAEVAMSPPCQARKLALAENATLECSYCDNVRSICSRPPASEDSRPVELTCVSSSCCPLRILTIPCGN